MKSWRASGSSSATGSSRMSSRGWRASATARATCACWPPESLPTLRAQRDTQRVEPGPGVGSSQVLARLETSRSVSATLRYLYSGVSWATNAMPSRASGDAGRDAAEHRDLPAGLADQPDGQLQQGGLAGPVRADQGDDPSGRDRQRAIAQRPGAPVALAQAAGLNGVHEAITPLPSSAEIMKCAGEQRGDPFLVQTGLGGFGKPLRQPASERLLILQGHDVEGALDERALAGAPGGQALVLQLPVGLEHRVRVDGQRGDHLPHLRQLVALDEIAEPQRVLDLLDDLQVGRDARARIEAELDGRRLARPRLPPYLSS